MQVHLQMIQAKFIYRGHGHIGSRSRSQKE